MELLLKRYFWTVHLAFLALVALLLARTANTFAGAALEPRPELDLASAPTRPAGPALVQASVEPNRYGHLYGVIPPPPPPTAEEVQQKEQEQNSAICMTCEPVKTNLRLQLLATMVANERRWSMALILDLDKGSSDYYRWGDKVRDYVVRGIERDPQRAVILNTETHRLEYIDAVPGSGAPVAAAGLGSLGTAPVPPPDGDAPPPSGDATEGIRQKGENDYSITRQKLDSTLGNLNDIATQARMVPSFKNGVANGFKLFSIRPGSVFGAIGMQNGDVISRINGLEINSPDKALEMYGRLKDAGSLDIELERRGQPIKKHYAIE
jgi:general secretion pathway protein C